LPAHDVEAAVIRAVADALTDPAMLIERIGLIDASAAETQALLNRAGRIATILRGRASPERAQAIRGLVQRIVISDHALSITMRRGALFGGAKTSAGVHPSNAILISVPIEFRRRGVEMKLVIPADADRSRPASRDPVLIKAVARGHEWFEDLATGRAASIQAIADREGIGEGYVRRLIRLAFLAPRIVAAILEGEQPIDLTAEGLTRRIELPHKLERAAAATPLLILISPCSTDRGLLAGYLIRRYQAAGRTAPPRGRAENCRPNVPELQLWDHALRCGFGHKPRGTPRFVASKGGIHTRDRLVGGGSSLERTRL
jgi:hypothetical protein